MNIPPLLQKRLFLTLREPCQSINQGSENFLC